MCHMYLIAGLQHRHHEHYATCDIFRSGADLCYELRSALVDCCSLDAGGIKHPHVQLVRSAPKCCPTHTDNLRGTSQKLMVILPVDPDVSFLLYM